MAALWEIFDTSNLSYDTELGFTQADSGFGPPIRSGWIRTGNLASGSHIAGDANCQAWTSAGAKDSGTRVFLINLWNSTSVSVINPWQASPFFCAADERVWCVQD